MWLQETTADDLHFGAAEPPDSTVYARNGATEVPPPVGVEQCLVALLVSSIALICPVRNLVSHDD